MLLQAVNFTGYRLIRRTLSVIDCLYFFIFKRLDEEDRPTGCLLCPKRTDVEINYKVCC